MKHGQHVIVRNKTLGGKEILEGEAILLHKRTGRFMPQFKDKALWLVQFLDEPDAMHERYISDTDLI